MCVLVIALVAVLAWLYWFITRSEEQGRAHWLRSQRARRASQPDRVVADWYWSRMTAPYPFYLPLTAKAARRRRLLGTRAGIASVTWLGDWQAHQATAGA